MSPRGGRPTHPIWHLSFGITEFLSRHGRSSIPFYILYRPQQDPYVFGELLTKDRVLDALSSTRAVASID